jgi:hypothetical protein
MPMSERGTQWLLVLLVACMGALLYLDWRRQGELEMLGERVDTLNLRLPREGERGGQGAVAPPRPVPPPPAAPAAAAPAVAVVEPAAVVLADPLPGAFVAETGPPAPTLPGLHPLELLVRQAHGIQGGQG